MNRSYYFDSIKSLFLILIYLTLIDLTFFLFFGNDNNSFRFIKPSLKQYFSYGESSEAKIRKEADLFKYNQKQKINYGWMELYPKDTFQNIKSDENSIYITAYGMSHTNLLAQAMNRIDTMVKVRRITAPGAPVSWSFSAFRKDSGKCNSDAAILGVMTDLVAKTTTTSGATMHFDHPYLYIYPRYYIKDHILKEISSPFSTFSEYITYIYDNEKVHYYKNWLKENDKYYNNLLFEQSILDKSTIVGFARRAYNEYRDSNLKKQIYDSNGFNPNSEEAKLVLKMIEIFAKECRSSDILPVIYIINNPKRSNHLEKLLLPIIKENNIPYLSTHKIAPPDDPRCFLSENLHFTLNKDEELANEMLKIIRSELKK